MHSSVALALAVIVGVVLVLGGTMFAMSSEKVSAGTVAVITRNGDDKDLAEPGRVWLTPIVEDTEVYQTSVQNLEFTGNEDASDAIWTDSVITQKTKDGVDVNYAAMLYFELPADEVRRLYKERGRSMDALVGQHIQVITRDIARDVLEQGLVDDIYLGGMEKYSNEIEQKLIERLSEIGVTVKSFDLTAIDPSDAYKQAIEQQTEQRQIAALEEEKVEVAAQQAEQKRVSAKGEADAAVIAAEGQAQASVIEAEADAEANRLVAESLTPEVLQAMYYETLATINWAILDSESVQQTMPLPTPEAEAEATPEG